MMWPSPGPGHASYGGAGGLLHDGDPVSSWPDNSANGNAATATGTARPTFKTNIVNGKPVVRYVAGNTLNLSAPITSLMPWTSFAVFKTNGVDAGGEYGGLLGGDSNTAWYRSDGYFICGGAQGLGYLPPSGLYSAYHIYALISSSGSAPPILFIDGTSYALTAFGTATSNNFTSLGAGPVDIVEVIHYSQNLPTLLAARAAGDRANIEAYLSAKYGLPVTSGGTAVDPSTVPGLIGWWKADSLG